MNADRLLAYYEQIADAPDAVPRLRRFILDLAVCGKLVEQDANDEPASELLKRIAAEKARLVKAGEIRKTSPASPISQNNAPFNLRIGWAWSTIGGICSKTGSGSTPRGGKAAYKPSGIVFLRSQNVYDDGLRLNDVAYIDSTIHERMSGTAVEKSDLLLNITGGSIGRCCLAPDDLGEANISQHVAIIRTAIDGPQDFLHCLILSPYFQAFIIDEQTGAGRGGLPKYKMDRIPVALPPLAEQHRIVAKVDELMAVCDRLAEARAVRETMRDRMAAASLARLNAPDPDPAAFQNHAAFALENLAPLTTRLDQIKELRQTILNLAVRGKLVPQDPNDESATELLKRIAAEKMRLMKAGEIGREKLLPSISIDQTEFEIPNGWSWCRLGSLSKFVTSGSRDWAKYYSQKGAIFVRMGNLSKQHYRLRLDQIQHVKPPSNREGTRTRLEAGDLLISITGDVGMLGLITENFGEAYVNQHTAMVRPVDEMKGTYLAELFRSPFAQDQFNAPQRGIKNSFRLTDVTQFLVPLPPLAEQRRIVAKVDELMALCDQIEKSLTTGDETRHRLLDAFLHEALKPTAEQEVTT